MLDPLNIIENEWSNIREGVRTAHHDFHSFVLSTIRDNNPESKTVILRFFNENDDLLGYSRFCRVKITINRLDWLLLDHKGHKRIEFDFDEKIKATWVAS